LGAGGRRFESCHLDNKLESLFYRGFFVYSDMKKIFIILIILTFNLIYSHSSNYSYNIMELSNRQTLGDINEDGEINIQDVILLVNLVLSNEYNDLADMNGDNI